MDQSPRDKIEDESQSLQSDSNDFEAIQFKPDFQILMQSLKSAQDFIVKNNKMKVYKLRDANIQGALKDLIVTLDEEQKFAILNRLVEVATFDSTIKVPYFLEILIVLIFECNVSQHIKSYYLNLISGLMENIENTIIIRRSQLIHKLIFYLRIETEFQATIISILQKSMNAKFSLSYLQVITYFMSPYASMILSPYIENQEIKIYYTLTRKLLGIPEKTIECVSQEQYDSFLAKVQNEDLFYNNLNLLLECLKSVILEQNDHESYYYFLGRESMIQAKGRFPLLCQQFSILVHLKYVKSEEEQVFLEIQTTEVLSFSILNDELIIRQDQKITKFIIQNDSLICLNFNTRFQCTINGLEVVPLINEITEISTAFATSVTIGSNESISKCLQGYMKFLYLFDQTILSEEVNSLWSQSQRNGQTFSQMLKIQSKARVILQLNTNVQDKYTISKELAWQTLDREFREMRDKEFLILRSQRKKQQGIQDMFKSMFSTRLSGKQDKIEQEPLVMSTKNVLYCEASTLLDVLKNFGNLDILFFPLHIISNQSTVIKLLELLTIVIERYGDDHQIQEYLRQDSEFQGLNVLSYILTVYIKKYGCSKLLAQTIIQLYSNVVESKCQVVQQMNHSGLVIFYNYEYWQFVQYEVLQMVFDKLLILLENESVLKYFKDHHLIEQLLYIHSVQLRYNPEFGTIDEFTQIRHTLLKSVIHIIYTPFAIFKHGTFLPEQLKFREDKEKDKEKQDKTKQIDKSLYVPFKAEIIAILNNIQLTANYDYLRLLNYMLKKPQSALFPELMYEERKKSLSQVKILDVMQQQFAMTFRDNEDLFQQGSTVSKLYITIYGSLVDIIINQKQRQDPEFDNYVSLLTEILVKVQVLIIQLEIAISEQDARQQNQKQRETQIVRQLLISLNQILDPRLQYGPKTYQAIINLSSMVFKKNLSMEREILDLLLPRFGNMTAVSKQIIVEFFLSCKNTPQFMSQLCIHKDILEFIKQLITVEQQPGKGQSLTSFIVLHHIENIRFAARKIIRFFHYANNFAEANSLLLHVLVNIIVLYNSNNKPSSALVDLFLLLPALLKVYPEIITQNPEPFIKFFCEYVAFLEKQQMLGYSPETDYLSFYTYEDGFADILFREIENKSIFPNGGVFGCLIYILFQAMELLIEQSCCKQLLQLWKRIMEIKQETKPPQSQMILIEDQEIPQLQIKIRDSKLKFQKRNFFQKIKDLIQDKQYGGCLQDLYFMELLKLQTSTHQHGDLLYDIFVQINVKFDYLNIYSFIIPELPQLNDLLLKSVISREISPTDIRALAAQQIEQFNKQNQIIRNLKQKNLPSGELDGLLNKLMKANSPLLYLELFKDDNIRKLIVYIRIYAFRQLYFAQELSILVNLHEIQDKVKDFKMLSNDIEQTSFSQTQKVFDFLPDFAATCYYLYNIQKTSSIMKKYETQQKIQQLIVQYKVKQHFKVNTHKRGLWYFMNEAEQHLYQKTFDENFVLLIQQERFQINSFEDSLRRRLFLKVFARQKKHYPSISLDGFSYPEYDFQELRAYLDQKKIKIQQEQDCEDYLHVFAEMITDRGFYSGKLRLTENYIMFENFGDSVGKDPIYKFQKDSQIKQDKQKLIPFNIIKEVMPRMYLLQPTALEIFTIHNKTYMFNVFDQQQIILKALQQNTRVILNPIEAFKKGQFTDKWRKGELSNFEYLMEVNKYAGRTYNDLNQYMVFPWVISNYQNNPELYRALNTPMGALNPKRLEQFLERFKQCDPEEINTYFQYGTHYSHSAIVLSFLMRLEPYASLHKELQSGKFDKPDRLFHSLESQWYSVYNSSSDVKELIPEFYYFSEFLKNKNKFDLGMLQSGISVSDVVLPEYVVTQTPEEMMFIEIQSLESEYVNQSLGSWIDLIFGIKSGTHKEAIKANNLFHRLTYALQPSNDDVQKEQFVTQVYYYGQTPQVLFKKEHPQRQVKPIDPILQFKNSTVLTKICDPILRVLYNDKVLIVITDRDVVSYQINGRISSHKLQCTEPKVLMLNFHEAITNKFELIDEYLFMGGHSEIKMYSWSLQLKYSIAFHHKTITCITSIGKTLICGSIDTRVSVWDCTSALHEPKVIIHGHRCEVQVLSTNEVLQIICSGDISGDILIHSLRGSFLKSIETGHPMNITIHPQGFLILHRVTRIMVYTLNGELYVDTAFHEQISGVAVISDIHPEFLIATEQTLYLSSIIGLRQGQNIKKKYVLEDLDVKAEPLPKKLKEVTEIGLINCIALNNRLCVLGMNNGTVITLTEPH